MNEFTSQLREAFNLMSNEFTSGEFTAKCRELGVPKYYTVRGNCGAFLHKYCEQINGSKRQWTKRRKEYNKQEVVNQTPSTITKETAISFLKNVGYKILEPITEYKEL